MRVLHLPSAVGGNAWNLSMAERSLGIESKVLTVSNNKFGFSTDYTLGKFNRYTYPFIALKYYMKELTNYDILHFNCGKTFFHYQTSLLDMIDLPLIKRTNTKIVFTYQGSDARMAKYCIDNYDITYFKHFTEQDLTVEYKRDLYKMRRIRKVDKYADQIYTTNPDLKNVLSNRTIFRPYTKIQLEEWNASYSDYSKRKIVFAHAPSNRAIKGTQVVLNVINELINEGLSIELRLIENMSNEQAIEQLKEADVVIDQLYAGWYGGLAVEAMALGKPVISYIREGDLVYIPRQMARDIPIINATDTNFEQTVRDILKSKSSLGETAKRSRKYVEAWHDSKKIAEGIIENYKKLLG